MRLSPSPHYLASLPIRGQGDVMEDGHGGLSLTDRGRDAANHTFDGATWGLVATTVRAAIAEVKAQAEADAAAVDDKADDLEARVSALEATVASLGAWAAAVGALPGIPTYP